MGFLEHLDPADHPTPACDFMPPRPGMVFRPRNLNQVNLSHLRSCKCADVVIATLTIRFSDTQGMRLHNAIGAAN